MVPSEKVEEISKHGVLGRHKTWSKEKILVLSNTIERNHPLRHTPCIPKAVMMETGEIIYEKVFASPPPPPKISLKDNWRKELGSEVAGGSEDSQQSQEIEKGVLFGCDSPNVSTVRLVESCASVC